MVVKTPERDLFLILTGIGFQRYDQKCAVVPPNRRKRSIITLCDGYSSFSPTSDELSRYIITTPGTSESQRTLKQAVDGLIRVTVRDTPASLAQCSLTGYISSIG